MLSILKNCFFIFVGISCLLLGLAMFAIEDGAVTGFILLIFAIIMFYASREIFTSKNMKWFDELPESMQERIVETELTLTEINPKVKNLLSKNKNKLYKIIYELLQNFTEDEQIEYFTCSEKLVSMYGFNTKVNCFVYCTNKKIIIESDTLKILHYEKINSIENNKRNIIIKDNIESITLQNMNKEDVVRLKQEINKQMELHKSVDINITKVTQRDITDKIARLRSLYEDGVLTEYEFNMKKLELLDKSN